MLGHVSKKGMKILASKGRISYTKIVSVDFYDPCVLSKQKKITFINICHPPKTENMELVHLYVYGFTLVSLVGRSQFYITFIGNYIRKVWVYF